MSTSPSLPSHGLSFWRYLNFVTTLDTCTLGSNRGNQCLSSCFILLLEFWVMIKFLVAKPKGWLPIAHVP